MTNTRRTNTLLAIFTGMGLLVLQGGEWTGTISLSQNGATVATPTTTTQAGAAVGTGDCTLDCRVSKAEDEIKVLKAITEKIEKPTVTAQTATPPAKVEEEAKEEKKSACEETEENESAIKAFECYGKAATSRSANKEDRAALAEFITGDAESDGCEIGATGAESIYGSELSSDLELRSVFRTQTFPSSKFRSALKEDEPKALAALTKITRDNARAKVSNKAILKCAANIVAEVKRERVESQIRPLLTRYRQAQLMKDPQLTSDARLRLLARINMLSTGRDATGVYHAGASLREFDYRYAGLINSLIRDEREERDGLDLNYESPFTDLYDWFGDFAINDKNPSFYQSPTGTRVGSTSKFSDFYRAREAANLRRALGVDFELGTGSSVVFVNSQPAGQSARILDGMNHMRNISGTSPFNGPSVRGNLAGRPLGNL